MDPSRPRSPQAKARSSPASPQPRSTPSPARTQAKVRPAQPQTQQRSAAGPASVKTTPPPSRVEVAGTHAGSPEHLAITPQPVERGNGTIEFDWEPSRIGTNRSYACSVTTNPAHDLTVTLEQGMYRRSLSGQGVVKVTAIPPAAAGTRGTLIARNNATGVSATYAWQWQPWDGGQVSPPKPPGLLARLFGKARTAEARKAAAKAPASVAERLGARAPLATPLKFFGEEAVGQRFAFILDRSGSMCGQRWEACTNELKRALRALPAHAEFLVELFSDHHVESGGGNGWMSASPSNVTDTIAWLDGAWPGGGTYPASAFMRVFTLPPPPDVLYFLTDGYVYGFTASACVDLRGAAPTIVNTIALESDASADVLTEIAQATGGRFILVSDLSPESPNG